MSTLKEIGKMTGTWISRGGSFRWRIPNFLSLARDGGESYSSPIFKCCDVMWFLTIQPKGLAKDSLSEWVTLFLFRFDDGMPKTLQVTICLQGGRGRTQLSGKMTGVLNEGVKFLFFGLCSRTQLKNEEARLMPDKALVLVITLKNDEPRICTDISTQTEEIEENQFTEKLGIEEWQKSLLKLLEGGNESDVVIKVKDKEFPAHRLILQARSAVFEAMFSHDMVEKQSGMVTMEDCNPNTFSDFLKYVYTGSMDLISTRNVFGLYFASDKYDMKKLKEQCANFIKRNLTVATFCETITLAVKFQEKELIELATEFFCANTVDIAKTVEWQAFLAENPTVGNELFILSCSQKK